MTRFPIDPQIREAWKNYPLRLSGLSRSRCCNATTTLVQSMEGGFVTRNCQKCGAKDTLPEDVFFNLSLWVACPRCKQEMAAQVIEKNYSYVCDKCQLFIRLADLLPRWTDL